MLTSFDGTSITHDEIGNPITYGNYTMSWNGRRLESINLNDTEVLSYEYNIDGQRISKTYEGVTTEYFYNGSILAGEKTGNNVIIYMYDNNGDIFGFTYNGTEYYYIKNAQNDVVAIADASGNVVVRYYYNAWGEIIDCVDNTTFELSSINPITYRSYYNDNIVGMDMYYLNSRYYMADWGRFLSADSYVQTGQGMLDKNMFAYCGNNPVNISDPTGNIWNWLKDKWEGFVSLFKKSKNRDTNISRSDVRGTFKNFSTVEADVKEEMYIAAENMINYYNTDKSTDKKYVAKSHKKTALNDLISPETIWGENAYHNFHAFINNGGDYIISDEYHVSMNIEGLSWDQLSSQQQQIIAENYLAWSQASVFFIGCYYGRDTVREVAEKAYLSRWD